MLRVNLTLNLSPNEARQVVDLIETFSPETPQSVAASPSKPNGSSPASQPSPGGRKPKQSAPPSESEVTAEELKPLVVKAFALDRGAVEAALKEVGVKKAGEADAAGRARLKKMMETILTPKEDEAPV